MNIGMDSLKIACVILSLAGLINATYFTLEFYGWVEASSLIPGSLCRTDDTGCLSVIRTSYGRIFRLPNSLLGMGFYLSLLAGIHFAADQAAIRMVLVALSGIVFLVGLYLIYALRVRLRARCPLCYLAHGINAAILVLLGISVSAT